MSIHYDRVCEAPSALLKSRSEDPDTQSDVRQTIEKELMRRNAAASKDHSRTVRHKRMEDKKLRQMETARHHGLYSGDARQMKGWK